MTDRPYWVASGTSEAHVRDRGSRFFAFAGEAADEEQAKSFLDALRARFPDATHHCWAYRVGGATPRERSSDDGEPAGTAGAPILQALRRDELVDVVAVVVRWFGGTKLGKGGLVRAYAEAARQALEGLHREERVPSVELMVETPLARLGAVKRLLRPGVELVGEQYGETARLTLRVHCSSADGLRASLAELGLAAREA